MNRLVPKTSRSGLIPLLNGMQNSKANSVRFSSVFYTLKDQNAILFEYIEVYYKRIRRDCMNNWLSPEALEQQYFKSLEGTTGHDYFQIK